MKSKKLLLIAIIVLLFVGVLAFFFLTDLNGENKVYPREISTLAFTLPELPEGFSVAERTPRTALDVLQEGIDLGWQEGYYARYIKGEGLLDASVIHLDISRYPLENISDVLDASISINEIEGYVLEFLPDPRIGERSRSVRSTDETYGYRSYLIEFYKKDIYVAIRNVGLVTDYELLQDLAKMIADKI